ncbi:hypothetical protein BJ875DRAFT_277292 [Amylocarpus encephaloides]|uniref:DUF5672 domain-containing protein n=1 Tax=Amylocarpus encephaloides TaxID=45428 RepID=A0A9P8C6I2_9HELO|nr:hypothetical protein BJ875DRAFT_277292 [Amylocarpus encephaloides]
MQIIFESRYRSSIIPLILHFGSVLGYSWPIVIYTSAESKFQFSTSSALGRYLKRGSVQDVAPAEHILIFQSDSMLCANAARSVEDYFEYDFVGAPIGLEKPKGYSGGLSLRKRSSALRVIEDWDWQDSKNKDDRFEDQWFYNRFKELQEDEARQGIDPEAEGAINLPTAEVARTFSVENIDYPSPLGVHQVHRWPKDKMAPLEEWCPEYKLCNEDQVKAVPEG